MTETLRAEKSEPLTYEQEVHALLYAAAANTEDLLQYFAAQAEGEIGDAKKLTQKCIDWKRDDLRRIRALIPQALERREFASKGEGQEWMERAARKAWSDLEITLNALGLMEASGFAPSESKRELFREIIQVSISRHAPSSPGSEREADGLARCRLGEILRLIERGVLVRNPADDHDLMKFARQGIELASTLKAAQKALETADPED